MRVRMPFTEHLGATGDAAASFFHVDQSFTRSATPAARHGASQLVAVMVDEAEVLDSIDRGP
jgi:hypothetical protein